MALRKYGTSDDQQVTGVEPTKEAEKIDKTASRGWDEDDERELLDEAKD